MTSADRFWGKVNFDGDGCWRWTGAVQTGGYGHLYIDHVHFYSHRLSYEWLVGPIPEALVLDHLCRVRNCVNPCHLEPVTQRDNVLRSSSPASLQAQQTHCIRGHAFDEKNTYWEKRRYARKCLACQKLRAKRRTIH